MKRLLFLIAFTATAVNAAPNPTGGSGTPAHDNTYTITGTSFGQKISPIDGSSLPWGYWDFEDGTLNPVDALSAGSVSLTDQNMSVAVEARGSSTRLLRSDAINWATFANGGIVSIVLNFPDQDPGSKQYFSVHRYSERSNYSHAGPNGTAYENWKFWRGYPNSGTTYPNTIISQRVTSASTCTGGGGTIFTVEGSAAVTISASAVRLPASTFMTEEYYIKYNTGDRLTDGIFRIRQDGVANLDKTNYNDDGATATTDDLQRQFIQDDPANLGDCGGATVAHVVKYDDVVADYGPYAPARVMLGDAPTLAACTILEYQPEVGQRTNTSIQVKLKYGSLGTTANKYIYVFDADDTVNANGLLLEAGVGNPAPTVSAINTSSGAAVGGGGFTLTGTGFINAAVKFGSIDATGVSTVNSTTITGTIPAGTPDTTVDVTVINEDEQEAILSSAYYYGPEPEDPIYVDPNPASEDGNYPLFSAPQ